MYVIKIDFKSDRPYYIKIDPDSAQQCYSPAVATVFGSKEDAMQWVHKNTSLSEYTSGVLLTEAMADFESWLNTGGYRCEITLIDNKYSRKYNNESKENVVDWLIWFKQNSNKVRYEDYATWPKLYELFNHIWELLRYEDNTLGFRMFIRSDSNLESFKNEIEYVLSKTTHRNKQSEKEIGIFDHYLSEHGNSVKISTDDSGLNFIVRSAYGSEKMKGTLDKIFNYLKSERYYESATLS